MISAEKFAEVVKANHLAGSRRIDIIISTNKEDINVILLTTLRLFNQNKSQEYSIKFLWKGVEVGIIDQKTIIRFYYSHGLLPQTGGGGSHGFDPAGDPNFKYFKCLICGKIIVVAGETEYVPECDNDSHGRMIRI